MKKRYLVLILAIGVICSLPGASTTAFAGGMDLAGMLVKNLGVTQPQAAGGAGSIFNVAKGALSAADFSKITSAMPEVSQLMKAAPGDDAVQGAAAALGKSGGSVGNLAVLAGSFSLLGMKGDMVGKFIPIVLDYSKTKGGDGVSGLLQSVLK